MLLNKNNSIKKRLVKLIGVNIFLIFLITIFAHTALIYVDKLQILNEYNEGHAQNYRNAVEELYRYIATEESDNFESFIYNIDNSINEGKSFLNYLEHKKKTSFSVRVLNTLSSEKHIFKMTFTIQSSYNLVKDYKKNAIAYKNVNDPVLKKKLLTRMARQETQIKNILKEFYTLTDKIISWATDIAIKLFWIFTFIFTFIAYKLGRNITESIINPIDSINDVVTKASIGNLQDLPYIENKDEITILYASLDRLFQNEKDIIRHAKRIIEGDYSFEITPRSKKDELSKVLASMTRTLQESEEEHITQTWLKDGLNDLNVKISGEQTLKGVSRKTLLFIGEYLRVSSGAIFIFNKSQQNLERYASYALGDKLQQTFELKEGLIGEAAYSKKPIIITDLIKEERTIVSGTISKTPSTLYIIPLIYKDMLIGVLELTFLGQIDQKKELFIKETTLIVAPALYVTLQRWELNKLLKITQNTNKKLKFQSRKLEQANKHKDDFLSNVTHELKTPLNSIILLSKLLWQNKAANLSTDEIKKAEIIHNAGNELLRLIEDLLNLSKMEIGESTVDIYRINSSQFLAEMRDIFETVAENKGLEFKIVDKYHDSFDTDKNKLSQIIRNFLSNAIKFTHTGSIELLIQKDTSTDEDRILFAIKDSGIGISKDKHSLIFKAFKQEDSAINKKYGGTGLGLSISSKFAKLIDGRINLKSEKGEGSTFYLSIPIKLSADTIEQDSMENYQLKDNSLSQHTLSNNNTYIKEHNIEEISSSENYSTDKSYNALIIDDDAKNIFTLSTILQNLNLTVFKALDTYMASNILSNHNIDIILFNITTLNSDELNLIKEIKENSDIKNQIIISITSKEIPLDKAKYLENNTNEVISKPIDNNTLVEKIKKYI